MSCGQPNKYSVRVMKESKIRTVRRRNIHEAMHGFDLKKPGKSDTKKLKLLGEPGHLFLVGNHLGTKQTTYNVDHRKTIYPVTLENRWHHVYGQNTTRWLTLFNKIQPQKAVMADCLLSRSNMC